MNERQSYPINVLKKAYRIVRAITKGHGIYGILTLIVLAPAVWFYLLKEKKWQQEATT